jgi:hypothetical protein
MTILMLAAVLTVGAQAQTVSGQQVLASVPFEFNVGNTTLPAGKYVITVLNPTSDRRILQVRSTDGRSSAMILTSAVIGKAADNAKLVFHRYGDRYFFAQAHLAGDATTLAAVKSRAERAEQAVAKSGKKGVITITAE